MPKGIPSEEVLVRVSLTLPEDLVVDLRESGNMSGEVVRRLREWGLRSERERLGLS